MRPVLVNKLSLVTRQKPDIISEIDPQGKF
jgi:hypothetical protein